MSLASIDQNNQLILFWIWHTLCPRKVLSPLPWRAGKTVSKGFFISVFLKWPMLNFTCTQELQVNFDHRVEYATIQPKNLFLTFVLLGLRSRAESEVVHSGNGNLRGCRKSLSPWC